MDGVTLQFQGSSNLRLHLLVLAAIGVALLAYGVAQLFRKRFRSGLIAAAAAFGAVGPALIIDAIASDRRRDRGTWMAARILAIAGTAGVIACALLCEPPARAAWMAAMGFQIAVAVSIFYAAVYAYLGTRRLATLMLLRCGAILALLLILFKPALSFVDPGASRKPVLPILVDRSASMATTDGPHRPSRYQHVLQRLLSQRTRLEEHFEPVWYHFGDEAQVVDSLDALHELTPDADKTDLATSLLGATAGYAKTDLAGVLLISDGIHNASAEVARAAAEVGAAIYTAAVGSTNEERLGRRNIEIVSVDAPIEAVKNNVTTIAVRLKLTGFAGEPAEIRLFEAGEDQHADVYDLRTTTNAAELTAKLKWTPKDGRGEGEGAALRKLLLDVPVRDGEAVSEDNAAEVHVLVTQPRIRVLYVEGSIRPEYKFLRRRLDSDPNVQFMALVRVSQNRFWASGGIEGRKLLALPTTEEDFALFDVLILGDLDASFLTRERMARVRQFVNDGGGLLMLGGHNSFGPGGYEGTDIEQVLPVTVGSRNQPQETTAFLPQLTAAGRGHAVFEGLVDYFSLPDRVGPAADTGKLPKLLGCVTVVQAKTAAEVLAIHPTRRNEHGPLIVLAVQRYGAGRAAAMTADTTWQWYMPMRAMGSDSPYHRLWGQLTRWLAHAETKTRKASSSMVLRTRRSFVRACKELRVLARVQDRDGQATQAANVTCNVVGDDGEVLDNLPMTAAAESGLFEVTYRPTRAGGFQLKGQATDAQGQELGADELPLTVATHSAEAERLARDDLTLARIAGRSNGVNEDISRLPELIDRIKARQVSFEAPSRPTVAQMYNFTLLFFVLVGLLTTEWMLRRNWQLH